MAWSFANARKWELFEQLVCKLWQTEDLGSVEWREICNMLPSDWGAHIPESDRYNARKMIKHAEAALQRATGMERR